jgi:hypothetical protein
MKRLLKYLQPIKAFFIRIIVRFNNIFYVKCRNCNNGWLHKIDVYEHGKDMTINIYKCSNCGNREGLNAL